MTAGPQESVRLLTFGCRLNAFESEAMKDAAAAAGLSDAIVVNTCAVTSEAVRQASQAIRRARRENPSARIIVTGCAAQTEPRRFADMPEVDHVLGNGEKLSADALRLIAQGNSPRIALGDLAAPAPKARLRAGFGQPRAYVRVQNGCDHRCTFCVIPFGRGPSRSLPPSDVVDQIRALLEAGSVEIVLSGVDLTAYGKDLPEAPTLGRLVRRILRELPELKRLRLSSIDPAEADDDLMLALAEEPRLMPHLHLSLQAGDDLILKRMKRRHSRADAIRFCDAARHLRPDLVFGADLIAGFPTETEAMFQNTLALAEDCGLAFLHVFPFSARPDTPAARMPQTHGAAIKERAARLRDLGGRRRDAYLASQVGRLANVMWEQASLGRTEHFAEVVTPEGAAGDIAKMRLTGAADGKLWGAAA